MKDPDYIMKIMSTYKSECHGRATVFRSEFFKLQFSNWATIKPTTIFFILDNKKYLVLEEWHQNSDSS